MRTRLVQSLPLLALCVITLACGAEQTPRAEDLDTMPLDPVVVARGLNGPIGVLVTEDGTIYVSDSGSGGENQMETAMPGYDEPVTLTWGETARVVRIDPAGTETVLALLPSLVIPEGPQGAGRLALHEGVLYVSSGAWGEGGEVDRPKNMAAIVRVADGTVTEFANTWDFENRENPEPAHRETNPFDLTVGPDNALWLTDAAGNTLYRIDTVTGELELKAVFAVMPGPIPNAARGGAMEIEPVPTAVAFDADGNVYVSLLGGVPFLPGSSKVVRVSPDGTVSEYATGLTMLSDLVTGPDGRLYGVSIGEFTDQGPVPNSGAVLRIEPGTASQAIMSGLSLPASIAFTANGDAYLTLNALGEPGTGQVVKYAGLMRMN
jgi:sugar lactone lactonase YvrE